MSYTIEYNKQFIKSEAGITPCWLAGDNNVTQGYGTYERRARDWGCFHNLIGVTEEDILESVQPCLGGYGEHWKKNGKYIDDAGLIRWIKNGVKSAATVEEIICANPISSIKCYLSVWGKDFEHCNESLSYCKTTEEFDSWIALAKQRTAELKAEEKSAYPVVDFTIENLRHPITKELPDRVLFQKGNMYLSEIVDKHSTHWSPNIKDALEFTKDEAQTLINAASPFEWPRTSTVTNAERKAMPYDAVLRFKSGPYKGQYIQKRTSSKIYMTSNESFAKAYASEFTAEKALRSLQPAVASKGELEIVKKGA